MKQFVVSILGFDRFTQKKTPYSDRVIKGLFWALIGSIVAQGINLLVSVPVARMLDSDDFGRLGFIQGTITMFTIFAGPSLGVTATKYIAEYQQSKREEIGKIVSSNIYIAISTSLLFGLLLYILAPSIARLLDGSIEMIIPLQISSIIVIFSGIYASQLGILAGFDQFKKIAHVSLIRGVISAPLLLGGVYFFGLIGAVISLAIVSIISSCLCQVYLIYQYREEDIYISYRSGSFNPRILVNFSLPAYLSAIVVVAVVWIGNSSLVNQSNGYDQMGIFNAANQWKLAILFLPNIFNQRFFPLLAENSDISNRKKYNNTLKYNLYL